jgi:hypothetical protein
VLPSVLIVYSGVLVEGEAGGEVVPSLAVDECVVDASFTDGKAIAFGHDIMMDSAHGVLLLAASFALRLASSVALTSSVMLCIDARCRAALLRSLISSFSSAVKLPSLVLSWALLHALISSFYSVVKLFRRALSHSRLA